jgi:hypothetical protein
VRWQRVRRWSLYSLDLKEAILGDENESSLTLWAYPTRCDVTGSKLGLGLTKELKHGSNAAVLLDAARY